MRNPATPLVALSCGPWDGLPDRDRRLLLRAASTRPVVYVQEAVAGEYLVVRRREMERGVVAIVPGAPPYLNGFEVNTAVAELLSTLPELTERAAVDLWVCSPTLLAFADELPVRLTIFDFQRSGTAATADTQPLTLPERDLLGVADLVLADGEGHLQAVRDLHGNVHSVPSAEREGPARRRTPSARGAAPSGGEWDAIWAWIDHLMWEALARSTRRARAGRARKTAARG